MASAATGRTTGPELVPTPALILAWAAKADSKVLVAMTFVGAASPSVAPYCELLFPFREAAEVPRILKCRARRELDRVCIRLPVLILCVVDGSHGRTLGVALDHVVAHHVAVRVVVAADWRRMMFMVVRSHVVTHHMVAGNASMATAAPPIAAATTTTTSAASIAAATVASVTPSVASATTSIASVTVPTTSVVVVAHHMMATPAVVMAVLLLLVMAVMAVLLLLLLLLLLVMVLVLVVIMLHARLHVTLSLLRSHTYMMLLLPPCHTCRRIVGTLVIVAVRPRNALLIVPTQATLAATIHMAGLTIARAPLQAFDSMILPPATLTLSTLRTTRGAATATACCINVAVNPIAAT